MKILKCGLLIILQVYGLRLQAGCHQEIFTITEILNHDSQVRHIFSCEILATYQRNSTYESVAVIRHRYRGKPQDTVYIYTGGQTTAGGSKMMPRQRWLIFSTTRDNLHYSATVCDHLAQRIEVPDDEPNSWMISPLGKMYLEVLDIYAEIRAEEFTGHKAIIANGRLIAEGHFIKGVPEGTWTHYSRRDFYDSRIKKSEITYKNGMLDGEYLIYHEDEDQNLLIEKRIYTAGKIVIIEGGSLYLEQRKYLNERKQIFTHIFRDSAGVTTKQYSREYLKNDNFGDGASYMSGYYFNKKDFHSGEYLPLGEGRFYRGKRVGTWRFFNAEAELIDTVTYPEIATEDSIFQTWDEAGRVRLRGRLDADGRRTGVWSNYYAGDLFSNTAYASDGGKLYENRFYETGGWQYTPYVNGKKHGTRIKYGADGKIRSLENFADGQLNGRSIFFNEDGSIAREENYRNGRRTTVYNNIGSNYYENGYRRGLFVQYDHATGRKTSEGHYWMGYRIGEWIQYKEDGSYQKQYYPTDKDYLMTNLYEGPTAWEDYDKDGNLMNRYEREDW